MHGSANMHSHHGSQTLTCVNQALGHHFFAHLGTVQMLQGARQAVSHTHCRCPLESESACKHTERSNSALASTGEDHTRRAADLYAEWLASPSACPHLLQREVSRWQPNFPCEPGCCDFKLLHGWTQAAGMLSELLWCTPCTCGKKG